MSMPDFDTIECEDCGSYNNSTIKCLCSKCREEIIEKWLLESDKLFEQSDIKRLKKEFGIEVKEE